jgi:hypothetical protein
MHPSPFIPCYSNRHAPSRRIHAISWIKALPRPPSSGVPTAIFRLRLLLSNRGTQYLSPKEASLRPLDDLLVDTAWWMVHHNCTLLVVDLCVHPGISDQVDNPLLAFVLVKSKSLGQILDIDPLVNLAV